LPSIQVISQDENKLSVKITGIPIQYANALRRICLNGIPVFAVDTVDIIENSSVLADEGIGHRLGMIPLRTDTERFVEAPKCECKSASGCTNCRVMLIIDSGETDSTRLVTSSELTSEDETVKPISDKIPIVELAPGQKIKLEAYARLNRGTENAKWNSANISVLTNAGKEDEHVLTVETTGALKPNEIILAGINELSNRMHEMKGVFENLKMS